MTQETVCHLEPRTSERAVIFKWSCGTALGKHETEKIHPSKLRRFLSAPPRGNDRGFPL